MRDYVQTCLRESGPQYNRALQDLVNRVKATGPRRSWVEPEQLPALLDGADEYLRPMIAVMAGAGLRVGEATALDWRATSDSPPGR